MRLRPRGTVIRGELMYYTDKKLQYPVRVEKPNPVFARMLQQAIGGVEGEIRVCMQYFFQAWGSRGPVKYRDMLLNTATEEIRHIEMLATAVALNLEKAPGQLQEEIAADPRCRRRSERHGHAAHPLDRTLRATRPTPMACPSTCRTSTPAATSPRDMYCNVAAEATGRVLATRLYNTTDDPGMKDMLSFNIARDTMHQEQWLAVLEDLGPTHLPIPNSFPQSQENSEFAYNFIVTATRTGSARKRISRGRAGQRLTAKHEFFDHHCAAAGGSTEPRLRATGYLRAEGAGTWQPHRHAGEGEGSAGTSQEHHVSSSCRWRTKLLGTHRNKKTTDGAVMQHRLFFSIGTGYSATSSISLSDSA